MVTESFRFERPRQKHLKALEALKQEFIQDGSSMDGSMNLKETEDIHQWLKEVKAMESKKTCPKNLVPHTLLLCIDKSTNEIIGSIQVRHELNDFLSRFGGHIGYSVRPTQRQKGYATKMLEAIKPLCIDLGLEKVLITCLKSNEASRRVILNNGGVYESTIYDNNRQEDIERYWINLKAQRDL
ncbi:GNAT family N-acetyltransferase [Dolosicoccus paucivorans]|uniref:GNAT family acetyltransferase n=1 Tax=Dolosicoccus paucivorans TaxID=84521 RepID=A0A1G8JA66_9LACT|nr:GNAT family N-acetyltransferase [Dolosicoccus paucivorans]PMB84578.1 GNAT family acetyltransferase [Dolosicoccus paucivorans]PMC58143.1 GNAT family acetyltransferase [Dolosicoccus paucivorans]SDI28159.1 Predicted acetyltransferase [Dolosicoccus paucivorans]